MAEDIVMVQHVQDSDLNGLDFLMLFGFILTVIVVAVILRLVLQLARARMLDDEDAVHNGSELSEESLLSLLFRRR